MTHTQESSVLRKQLDQLKQLIHIAIIELMDCGGTTPEDTYDVVAEQKPDLCRRLGKAYVMALSKAIQCSDLPAESRRFQAMFETFNRKYFGGRLPHYEVQVVHDIEFWIGKPLEGTLSGFTDLEHRRIFLRRSMGDTISLTCEMASVATNDWDGAWRREIKRLGALGAPVPPLTKD
jgi:hypothetical protein